MSSSIARMCARVTITPTGWTSLFLFFVFLFFVFVFTLVFTARVDRWFGANAPTRLRLVGRSSACVVAFATADDAHSTAIAHSDALERERPRQADRGRAQGEAEGSWAKGLRAQGRTHRAVECGSISGWRDCSFCACSVCAFSCICQSFRVHALPGTSKPNVSAHCN
jgi:hypothetical protein